MILAYIQNYYCLIIIFYHLNLNYSLNYHVLDHFYYLIKFSKLFNLFIIIQMEQSCNFLLKLILGMLNGKEFNGIGKRICKGNLNSRSILNSFFFLNK